MATSKFTNIHNIPVELLVEVRYSPRDNVTRLIKGGVTNLAWGRWKANETGYLHVADALLLVESGAFAPVHIEDYQSAVRLLRSGGVPQAVKKAATVKQVEHLKYVGPRTAEILAQHSVTSIEQIAEMSVDNLLQLTAQAPHITVARAEEIIADAKKQIANS